DLPCGRYRAGRSVRKHRRPLTEFGSKELSDHLGNNWILTSQLSRVILVPCCRPQQKGRQTWLVKPPLLRLHQSLLGSFYVRSGYCQSQITNKINPKTPPIG